MKAFPQPRKRPRQARSEQMVELILEATARLLAERGYAGMTTNMVAARAGVSVGSVYQYFPPKESLVAALHERHAAHMARKIEQCLLAVGPGNLEASIEAVVRAMMSEHESAPELHRVLEQEFRFFDAPIDESPAAHQILCQVRGLLEANKHEISTSDLDLAAWSILQVTEAMVHAAVIEPPWHFSTDAVERSIVDVILGYLRYKPAERRHDLARAYLGERRSEPPATRQLQAEAN